MALKSRLELEVDGRTAEQHVIAVRVALEALTQAGLRTGPALASVFNSVSGSVSSINAATSSIKAAQSALNGLSTSGSKAGQSLSGAAGSLSTTGANAAAAEARLAAATRAMNELQQSSARATAALNGVGGSVTVNTRNAAAAVGNLNSNMGSLHSTALSLAGPLLGLFGGAQLVGSIYQASEAYSTLTNRLKLVTTGSEELVKAQQSVFEIAQGARQPLTSTAELYQRIATNQKELGLTGEGVADVVGTISKTLAISGASAASANAALIQLGQAFASGTLRGEELNSVMEQAPALAQAIAAGMGKTVGELRTLGAAGLLTADAVVKALQAQQGAVEELFQKTSATIGQSLTSTGNSFTQLIGKLDQASGASASISESILSVSKYMDGLTASGIETQKTLDMVGNTLTVVAAGGLTYYATKAAIAAKATADSIYQYYASRSAAIASAQATLNQSNADVIRARTATLAAQADLALYRGTILQTVAVGRLAEARLAQASAEAAAARSSAALRAAQGGMLGVLGGPGGLALTVAGIAATYLLFRDNADDATRSLVDQNLTVEESIAKFKELGAAQRALQLSTWSERQISATDAASEAFDKYVLQGQEAFRQLGANGIEGAQAFNQLVEQVRNGSRTLPEVTDWIKQNQQVMPGYISELERAAAANEVSSQQAKKWGDLVLQAGDNATVTTGSIKGLADAQAASQGQTRAQLAEWEKYIAKLAETRDLLGANEAAEAKYRAAKIGLTAEQTKQAEVVAGQIDTLKKYQDAIKENDKVQQAALKAQLIALYTQQQAAEDAAAAVKKSHDDAAKAATDSANIQIAQMQRVIDKAVNLTKGRNLLLAPEQPQQNLSGYGLLTNGGTPAAAPVTPRKTPQQMANEAIAQLNTTTNPNASTLKDAKVLEDAGQKLLDSARQRYAVLQQQSREIEAQGSSSRTLGTEAKKLIELETEIANLKEKRTLTTAQKQVLAMAELNLAQQKQNAALERANELTKEQYENTAKLKAYQDNLNSQLGLEDDRYKSEIAGAGQGDKVRQRMQEALKIQQDYQNRVNKITNEYNDSTDKSESRKQLYEGQLAAESDTLNKSLARQQQHYAELDALRGEWLLGVSDSWQNYVDMATDYNQQARDATASILGDTTSSLSQGIQDVVTQTESLGDAFVNLGPTMANSVLGALADITAQWLVTQALKMAGISAETTAVVASEGTKAAAKVAGDTVATTSTLASIATTLAANVAAAATTIASWLPAALVASIGSFGAAAVVGGGALLAAYALIKGFSNGGYTGAGGVNEPAGVVHKGEVVWSQADISRFGGVASVEALRKGNVTPIRSNSNSTTQSSTTGNQAQPQQTVVQIIEDSSKAGKTTRSQENGNEIIRVFVSDFLGDGQSYEAVTSKLGVQGVGR
ncbi:hypothetical protein PS627_00095 [Pseudomonas fluorescens]|uniref:tape measure protein n=1 Tax=Pseudomonas fluorescens TaxID=294 RepID=UPI001255D939|nr:tape measure protein [Pseudomonas fluorescens]CAG8863159.1 hypothetical protein PS627_00095 [Pseudomonas fluorescens]